MIEESGVVVEIDGDYILVETQPKSACGHCNVGDSCGTSVLAKWFTRKRNQVRVYNQLGLQAGDKAVVGVADDVLIKAAFITYMLPLLSMVSFAILGSAVSASDMVVTLFSILGLFIGLLSLSLLNKRSSADKYQASLIRGESANKITL